AEAHAAEDEALKAGVEARNELDNIVYQSEKQITDLGDKIPEDKKTELEGAIVEGKAVLENQEADADSLKAAKEKIMGIMESFAQDLYSQQAAEGAGPDMGGAAGPEAGASEPKPAEDAETVDADFEVVDEDKK
ncbi:MAG: Hsp70 family protein, partial [Opitutales bacterium]|nr:Hsp70 family protein [Opitutales bacterium]